jgi:hypothetical protein
MPQARIGRAAARWRAMRTLLQVQQKRPGAHLKKIPPNNLLLSIML